MSTATIHLRQADEVAPAIRQAAELLNAGGLVVLPTETVYGVAGRLDRPEAIDRLRRLRGAAEPKPFTVHLASRDQALRYIDPPSHLTSRLMKRLWPGPVALVIKVSEARRREVAAQLGLAQGDLYDGEAITLRCPDHFIAREVLGLVDGPVAAMAAEVSDGRLPVELEGKIDLLLEAGPGRFARPSTVLAVTGDRYEILRPGVYDERIIERRLRTTLLFVCSGNTCRSPMAEAVARQVLAEKLGVPVQQLENEGFTVMSAGSFALPGTRATPEAVEAVRSLGGDLSQHRSRLLTVELINQADVVFTMGQSHSAAVAALVPGSSDKIVALDPQQDIADPIGGDQTLYTELAGELKQLIEQRLAERGLP